MKAYDQFKSRYYDLKKKEDWKQIVLIGNTALEEKIADEERAEIHEIMATTHHYLGEYDNTIQHAGFASKFSKDINLKAKACYLASAGYRNKCNIEPGNVSYQAHARQWIDQALELTSIPELEDRWRAKVYFNAGALYHDVFHDNFKAQNFYRQACHFYSQGSDDYNRTQLRMIRSTLESGDSNQALLDIEALREYITPSSKTHVHFLQLEAKIAIKQECHIKADDLLKKALHLAEKKGMSGDFRRLQNLKDNISTEVISKKLNSLDLATFIVTSTFKQRVSNMGLAVKAVPKLQLEEDKRSWVEKMISSSPTGLREIG